MRPRWYVLTGGPCSGKTTLINELKDRGYSVLPESARTVIAAGLAQGKTIQQITSDGPALQRLIVEHQYELESQTSKEEMLFLDRGNPDNIAYARKFGVEIVEDLQRKIEANRYRKIFLLDLVDFANDAERYETPEEARALQESIQKVYEELGYDIVRVPVLPVPERTQYVLARL